MMSPIHRLATMDLRPPWWAAQLVIGCAGVRYYLHPGQRPWACARSAKIILFIWRAPVAAVLPFTDLAPVPGITPWMATQYPGLTSPTRALQGIRSDPTAWYFSVPSIGHLQSDEITLVLPRLSPPRQGLSPDRLCLLPAPRVGTKPCKRVWGKNTKSSERLPDMGKKAVLDDTIDGLTVVRLMRPFLYLRASIGDSSPYVAPPWEHAIKADGLAAPKHCLWDGRVDQGFSARPIADCLSFTRHGPSFEYHCRGGSGPTASPRLQSSAVPWFGSGRRHGGNEIGKDTP